MKSVIAFLKKLQLRQILTVFLAGLLLVVTTACSGPTQAANPNRGKTDLLYPGAETPQGRMEREQELPLKGINSANSPKAGGLNQRQIDLGDRAQGRVETAKEAVKDASGFLKNKADEASARPELQKNPALGK